MTEYSYTPLILVPGDYDLQLDNLKAIGTSLTWCSRAVLETYANYDQMDTDYYADVMTLKINYADELAPPEDALPNMSYMSMSNVFDFSQHTISGMHYPAKQYMLYLDYKKLGSGNIEFHAAVSTGPNPTNFVKLFDSNLPDSQNSLNKLIELGDGDYYRFKIIIRTDGDSIGGSVNCWGFYTDPDVNKKYYEFPPVPELTTPENEAVVSSKGTTLIWNPNPKTFSYDLQIYQGSTLFKNVEDLFAPYYMTGALAPGAWYNWRVRAENDYGKSDWTDSFTFETEQPAPSLVPTLSSPADNTVDFPEGSFSLRWNKIAQPYITYQVELSDSATFDGTVWSDATSNDSSYCTRKLDLGKTYYWRVRAANTQGAGPWSSVWKFTMKKPALGTPLLYAPFNGCLYYPADHKLRWSVVDQAAKYEVQAFKKADPNDLWQYWYETEDPGWGNPTEANFWDILTFRNTPDANSKVYWRIRAIDSDGKPGNWSTIYNFTYSPEAITAPDPQT